MMNTGKLAGRTLFITGASRGIGKEIALKAARDGANIVIAAKTAVAHPKLPGTIYTAAEEIENAGGRALPCVVDVRNEEQVKKAINDAVAKFGGIDILVNNSSAISLTGTLETDMKRYDLMHTVNTRGTFLVSKLCLPHLLQSNHAHILNISPPLNLNPVWFAPHVAYTMAKYGMSMCVLGMSREFADRNIAVNALWPRTAIATAAIDMLTGGEGSKYSRKPEIMADAAYAVLIREPRQVNGQFLIDDEVLLQAGVKDLSKYACYPENANKLMADFFLDLPDTADVPVIPIQTTTTTAANVGPTNDQISTLFTKIEPLLSTEIVSKVQAVYQFNITGAEKSTWFLDLKHGAGACGQGTPKESPDVVFTMKADNFTDMFSGKLKAANAYMTGKLKFTGDLEKGLKLEKLMKALKAKL